MVASKHVMHKPKKAKSDELERMAAAARKICNVWKHAKLRKPLLQVRRSTANSIARLCASLAFRCADGACGAQCIALAKKRRADVFEKRTATLLAVYKEDAAERQRRIVAMKMKTDELDGVRSLAEHVARSPSATPARECVAQGCASTWRALCRLCSRRHESSAAR